MRRHHLDVVSLVSGLLFAGLGVIFALNALGTFDFDVRVVPATVLIVLGVAGIAASIARAGRRAPEPRPEPELETEPELAPAADE